MLAKWQKSPRLRHLQGQNLKNSVNSLSKVPYVHDRQEDSGSFVPIKDLEHRVQPLLPSGDVS